MLSPKFGMFLNVTDLFAVRLGPMRHILLTWNPGPHDDEQWSPEQWEIEMVDGTSEGRTYDGRWSVGNRVQGIEPGDRLPT